MSGGKKASTAAPVPAERKVPCPTCGRPSLFAPQNPWRPFCSERCRSVDFGAWASESYRVATQDEPDDESGNGGGVPH